MLKGIQIGTQIGVLQHLGRPLGKFIFVVVANVLVMMYSMIWFTIWGVIAIVCIMCRSVVWAIIRDMMT